jgi:hypothetical protein
VRLTAAAVRELFEVRFTNASECGGWALGFLDRDEVVLCALRPGGANGSNMEGGRNNVTFVGEYAQDLADRYEPLGWWCIGMWHSHPGTSDEPLELSDTDIASATS